MHETVGMIGTGLLGSAMAVRLSAAGRPLLAYDIDRCAVEGSGAAAAASNAQVADQCRTIVLSLPDSHIAAAVIEEIRPYLQSGDLIIDTTTGDPAEAEAAGVKLAKLGVYYLDATIGGNSRQARHGEVIALVGGEVTAFERALPLFDTFCRRSFHLGHWGAGARMKLVLNLVLGLNRAVLAEGLSFAAACGFDLHQTLEILQAGPSYSKVMDVKGEKMIRADYTPEARLAQHHKDVRLILAEAERHGAKTPLSAVHDALLRLAEERGFASLDNSAVIEAYRVSSESNPC
ncbi:MAG: NAD(P)-dependent oxidoreductase [Acidobacteria bacterium]|nr:NAD(P)-dependent oxidoreductase [Acidobacteriota bacterium]